MLRHLILLVCLLIGADTILADTTSMPPATVTTGDSALYQYKLDSMRIAMQESIGSASHDTISPEDFIPFFAMLIPIGFIIATSLLLYRRIEARRTERLAMIERGVDPSLFVTSENEGTRKYSALRAGMLLAGFGLGLLVGAFAAMNVEVEWRPLVIIAPSLLCGGLGLITYHIIARKLEKAG